MDNGRVLTRPISASTEKQATPEPAGTPDSTGAVRSPERVGARRKFWIVSVVILLILGSGVALFEAFKYEFTPKRFGVVDPGLVYRSGQISPRMIEPTLRKHGIRTVIDLQGLANGPVAERDAEQAAVRALGIDYHQYGLSGNGTGPIVRYADALQTLVASERAGRPVLVHCAAGTQRTGVAIAFYRVLVEKRPPAEAYAEMAEYQWSAKKDAIALDYINSHMGELAQLLVSRGVIDTVPEPLPQLKADQ